jgi:transposase
MAETRRKFDQEFCHGAVRIVQETGKPGQLSTSEYEELLRLRKEIAELTMELDVLKRSVVVW